MAGETTLGNLLWQSIDKHADQKAQTWYEDNEWKSRTYREFGDAIEAMAAGLLSLGVKKGDRVCVWSKNSPRWAEVDMACQSAGTVSVPIYDTLTAKQGGYIINNCGAKIIFVQDKEVMERVQSMQSDIKGLQTIILLSGTSRKKGVMTYDKLIKEGKALLKKDAKCVEKAWKALKPKDHASFVYTSGTTGDPKGVILTQWNLASNGIVAQECVEVGPGDVFLSFLPLSHVFERTGGHFTAYFSGAHVFFARSIETLTDDMAIAKPTLMMSVPRLYEKIYARIQDSVAKSSFVKRAIFNWAINQGHAANVYRQRNEPIPKSLQKKLDRADRLVFGKLKARVGGNLRYFVSGGAALSKEIEEFFWAAGIQILQGYGLTETSPVINVARPGAIRFGSVGKAVPGATLKIDTKEWHSERTDITEGEICVKGPMVMEGYYKNKKATDEVFDKDGFFHTGDVGYLDDDGFLFITDRKKEMIVMSNGKNVAPQNIEGLLKLQPHIAQACAIGEKRKYMSALICPDWEVLEEFALKNGIGHTGQQLVSDQRVVSLIEKEVELVNQQLSRYEQIKKFWIVDTDWTVEGGELTPTLKLKRRILSDKYKDLIEQLYPGK